MASCVGFWGVFLIRGLVVATADGLCFGLEHKKMEIITPRQFNAFLRELRQVRKLLSDLVINRVTHELVGSREQEAREPPQESTGDQVFMQDCGDPMDRTAGEEQHTGVNSQAIFPIRWGRSFKDWWANPFRNRPNIAEGLTAFITAALLLVGFLQWSVYRGQLRIMRDQLNQADAAQGAQLAFHDFNADTVAGKNAFTADVTIPVTNYGPTAANEVKFWFQRTMTNLRFNANDPKDWYQFVSGDDPRAQEPSGASIGPHETKTYRFHLTWDRSDEIRRKRIEISTIYYVSYVDIFSKRRTVQDCAVYNPDDTKWFSCPPLGEHGKPAAPTGLTLTVR